MKSIGYTTKIAAGLLASAMTMSANAALMTITPDGGFSSGTNQGGGNMVITNVGMTSSLSWGTEINNQGQSSLVLTDEATVSIESLNTNYLLSTLTHNNNPIDGDPNNFLDLAEIIGNLTSTGLDVNFDIDTLFDINFKETANLITFEQCQASGNNGETGPTDPNQHDHGSICDDRFDYTVDGSSFPVTIPVSIGGITYNLSLFGALDNLGNNPIPDNRFWTKEGESTNVYTFARLSEVPEPASIAILGLGLLGLATSRKRKAK